MYRKRLIKEIKCDSDKTNPLVSQKLLLHNYRRLLSNVKLFGHLPQLIVIQLLGAVSSEIFMSNDALVKAGTRGEALYFVASGTVAVYNNVGKEVRPTVRMK